MTPRYAVKVLSEDGGVSFGAILVDAENETEAERLAGIAFAAEMNLDAKERGEDEWSYTPDGFAYETEAVRFSLARGSTDPVYFSGE